MRLLTRSAVAVVDFFLAMGRIADFGLRIPDLVQSHPRLSVIVCG